LEICPESRRERAIRNLILALTIQVILNGKSKSQIFSEITDFLWNITGTVGEGVA
jgi:hypothetical protein